MKETYTKAILELLKSGKEPDAVIKGVRSTMLKRGHQNLLLIVLQNVLRVLETEATGTNVFVASEKELDSQLKAIKAELEKLGADTEPSVLVDETLIGGFVVEHNYQRSDKSYKNALTKLYRNVTKN